MVRCQTQLLPSSFMFVDLASEPECRVGKIPKNLLARRYERFLLVDTWPGRTGRSEGDISKAAPLSNPLE